MHPNKLLNVKIQKYYHLTKHVLKYQTTDQYTLPEYLLNIVELIEGLHMNFNDRLSMVSGTYTSDPGYVSREVLQRLYSLEDALVRNKQVSAGAIEYNGGGFNETYLNTSQSLNDVLPRKVYKQIGLNFGGGIESTLDMDMLADTASNVELWYMNYQVWMYGIALDVFNSKEKPMVLSVSYGWAEWDQCSLIQCGNLTAAQYIKRANNEFLKLAATGVSVLVASGDAGAPGRTNEGCNTKHQINPVYPGSSPWVTSVGATFVVQDKSKHFNYTSPICQGDKCATGVQSKPVNFNDVQWTSGGGFSLESRPKWQNDYVNEYLKSGVHLPNNTLWNSKGRGYPDVVANGHNCPVYGAMGSGFCDVDGTSCSTPVVAAIVSLLNDYQVSRGRKQLGFLNPLLYQMKQDNPSSYGKVLPGNNACTEACCCGEDYGFTTPPKETHWNPVSGLGSPVFTEMKQYLDSLEDGQCIE